MARKRKSKPTSKARAKVQTVKDRYSHAREDAQLAGLIQTTPEEALRPERVDPALQSEQPLPGLIGQAIRNGWAVPENKKPRLVDELVGIIENPEVAEVPKVMAYNALTKGDQVQFERDNPDKAARAKAAAQINTQVNVQVGATDPVEEYKRMLAAEAERDRAERLPSE